ncbi:hypothetical protein Vretifemale_5122 [Volvox reticuliferus]|uniref:DIRP domain-containing protein n=1 Tax=Volvox reticuliferus TaxID=1737510 RepID=A0A8J4FI24_9CHLO|nr:hypothetical protein Vretifemale_5122 [Volvox reticuliferus]
MAGASPLGKLEDEVLRKFYRSFHKHGAPNWAKISKDTKLSVEQCETLHKQHMSFLGLPASPAFETAFLAMVDDHYYATQNLVKDEVQIDDAARGGRQRRGEQDEAEAQVPIPSSQKPKRTPKPTPQRLAAEEEAQARRLARANHGTPKSSRAKVVAKAPPSPPLGEWTSSQRKRSRRLFEDSAEVDAPRYRSPVDRWRGRHNNDFDEGVDALLSLASGAHVASVVDEHPGGPEMATNTADLDYDMPEPDAPEPTQETPPKRRGTRGTRGTPTPTGTPIKAGARPAAVAATTVVAAAAADAVPMPSTTVLRSPRIRVAASSAAAVAAGASAAPAPPPMTSTITASARPVPTAGIRVKKEPRGSPTTSQPRGGTATATPTPATADVGGDANAVTAPQANEAAASAGNESTPEGAGTVTTVPLATSPGPSGRPVRKRKPTAIALAAAAAAEEEDGVGGRGLRSVVAAVAAAVAAAEATQAAAGASMTPPPESAPASPPAGHSDEGPSTHAAEMANNTAVLLASVPPVRTRASARLAVSGPGSRRAGERHSPTAVSEANGKEASPVEDEAGGAAGPGPISEAQMPTPAPAPALGPIPAPTSGRAKASGGAGVHTQAGYQVAVPPAIRFGPARATNQPPAGRTRRRKSLPERLPQMWESLKVPAPQAASGGGATVASDAAGTSGANGAGPGEASTAMSAAEIALRHCLGPRMRRWCMYEFVYSALDRPWFLRNELLEFCALHMQLPTTKLTRLEWSVLRAALGRPRRLSLAFLREERLRLEGYREHARIKYEEVALGMEVPHELPRQLRVGQEVAARHPHTRQLYDGVILTVKGSKYRVQFHRGDLMSEVIPDTDVMPLDPHECMPLHMAIVPFLLNGRAYDPVRLASLRGLLPPPGMALRPPTLPPRPLGSYATGLDTQMMRDQDAMMVAEVQRALEVKEDLVAQLTQLNNEAASGLHTDENGNRTDNFQLKYTNVVLKLRDTNSVLEAALSRLQARQQQINAAAAASTAPVTFGPALALQQQQQLVAANAAIAAVASTAMRPCDSGGVMPAAAHQPQALPSQGPMGPTPSQPQVPSLPAPQTPPAQAQATPPVPAAAPSPNAAVLGPLPISAAAPPVTGSQVRPAANKAMQVQPLSPGAPLVVPPPRPSAAAAAPSTAVPAPAVAGLPHFQAQGAPPSGPGMQVSNPEHLVEQALSEARTVVDSCRGKGTDGASLLLQSGAQSVPVVAPIILQAPGGASVPLVLPPGAILPQLVLQPPAGADGQLLEQVPALAVAQPSHTLPADGDESMAGRDTSAPADCSGIGAGDTSVELAEPTDLVRVKVEDETSLEKMSEFVGSADRTVEAAPSACPSTTEQVIAEEELAERWLRDVIVGCVGVLFTIQKCTAGNVPASTVAEALDLAVQQLQIRTDGENDALYGDIVQSVQGLKGHLTRAFA